MIGTFINAWKIADLRKKMLFTALIVLIFRIGAAIPIPFTNITEGIVDPTTVTKSALQYASSIASSFLTAEAAVVEIPEPKEPAMPQGGMY